MHPKQEILDKYADVLVNFALNDGKGINKGQVVSLEVPECAKPLLVSLQKAVLKAGAHYITNYLPDDTMRYFYELANEEQLDFFASKFFRGKVDQIDHSITILAETNKKELEGIDSKNIMRRSASQRPYRQWREEKENAGRYTWVLALYGTEAMAREAGLTLDEYWQQIIKACYLDSNDSIEEWKKSFFEVERVRDKLNAMKIESVHVKSDNVDLHIGLGKNRTWMGGSGRNIPSFEVFISPDWRKTEGKIAFDQPLYRYGNLVEGIKLEFQNGIVSKFSAIRGEDVIKEMIAQDGGNKVGEFSLTDSRLSRIDKFMAETLFDENFGGKYGNTHIALGSAYKDSYPGDPSEVEKEKWAEMGYNESVVHTDMISTENRIVTAKLEDGKEIVIYRDGQFTV